MQRFLQQDFAGSIEAFEALLTQQRTPVRLCNLAAAELGLELSRKCIKTCNAAIQLDPSYLPAYLIKARAYLALDKRDKAQETWRAGVAAATDDSDILHVLELQECLSTGSATVSEKQTHAPTVRQTAVPTPAAAHVEGNGSASVRVKHEPEIPLDQLHAALCGNLPRNARNTLANATGEAAVDDIITIGYWHVNSGRLEPAIYIFEQVIAHRPQAVAALLGLGSAYALLSRFDEAIVTFSHAIASDPSLADAWKRRGQTRVAKGLLRDGIADLAKAIQLSPDGDAYMQRGIAFHKLKDFRSAAADFERALACNERSAEVWNFKGMCETQLGDLDDAIASFEKAIRINPNLREAWMNKANVEKEFGRWEVALQTFAGAERKFADHPLLHHYLGTQHHLLGHTRDALKHFSRCIEMDPADTTSYHMRGVCQQTLGHFENAIATFNKLLEKEPAHHAWYNREIGLFVWGHLDDPLSTFSMDHQIDPRFKDGQCKKIPASMLAGYVHLQAPDYDDLFDDSVSEPKRDQYRQLVNKTAPIAKMIQLRCIGFTPNARQHRMFGLATLEVAQVLRQHLLGLLHGAGSASVPNASSSSESTHRTTSSLDHPLGWRDLADIAVRWRQISEPNDAVWWIDRLPDAAFKEGFGLQTPMFTGQMKTIRYYSYFAPAFEIMKRLMPEQCDLTDEQKNRVANATLLDELHGVAGQDFFVVTPCQSMVQPERVMEGTRLTIIASYPSGYEFSIRTAGLPDRWAQFDEELSACIQRLQQLFVAAPTDDKMQQYLDLVLQLFFYWVNFAPLSRGSAACGYVLMTSFLNAVGLTLGKPMPESIQFDWEAILRSNPMDFVEFARPWLVASVRRLPEGFWSSDQKEMDTLFKLEQVEQMPASGDALATLSVADVCATYRDMIHILGL